MADEAHDSFDLERLRQLVELMEKHDLREVKLKRGDQKWCLRRGVQEVLTAMPAGAPLPAAPGSPATAPPPPSGSAPSGEETGLVPIKSPTVGTFYRSPQPGDPPFVKPGDRVHPETIVCIVEAMKVFNQIPAEISGTVEKALVSDGDPVDFGQALFLVRPE